MKKITVILVVLFSVCAVCGAQTERGNVRKGNRDFRKSRFDEAEINYKKALVADSTSVAADYNLGNTYFRMENYGEAEKYYSAAADSLAKGEHGADLYHNLGNSLLAHKEYQKAIEAYKNALRRRPGDMETKANLAYAQKMLEDQQNQQDQNQNQDQNQEQNQDQQDKQDNQDQQDQQDKQNQDQQDKQNQDQNQDQNQNQNQNQDQDQNQNQDQQNQQGQQPKISPQAAQQMLQAIQDQEKDTQEKVKKEKALQMRSKQKEKNW